MFMGPRNWCQGINSASLCSLAGRYENPIPPRCLAPIDFLKIPALAGRYDNPIPTQFLAPTDCSQIPILQNMVYNMVRGGGGEEWARIRVKRHTIRKKACSHWLIIYLISPVLVLYKSFNNLCLWSDGSFISPNIWPILRISIATTIAVSSVTSTSGLRVVESVLNETDTTDRFSANVILTFL